MKTEIFSIDDIGNLFANANPMHDCSFTASFENSTLILTFVDLDSYYDDTPWFENFKKLTIKYHNTDFITLRLKHKKKQYDFYDTVTPLDNEKSIMVKFAIDTFNQMILDFRVDTKKKTWEGILEIAPQKIEYIWE